jgi:hypothetical protein
MTQRPCYAQAWCIRFGVALAVFEHGADRIIAVVCSHGDLDTNHNADR